MLEPGPGSASPARTSSAPFVRGSGPIAIVEAAEASGLERVAAADRDAFAATSRGTGELIAAACEAGASHILVAVGGTASTDAGAGALEALDDAGVDPELTVICDVRTRFEDAARVFAPQKGADPQRSSGCSDGWRRSRSGP